MKARRRKTTPKGHIVMIPRKHKFGIHLTGEYQTDFEKAIETLRKGGVFWREDEKIYKALLKALDNFIIKSFQTDTEYMEGISDDEIKKINEFWGISNINHFWGFNFE